MSIPSSIWKRTSRLALGLLLATPACSKKAPAPAKALAREEVAAPRPQPSKPLPVTVAVPAQPAPIDPALIPVEEDFRQDAEQKLTKKSDLRSELQRIEREISAPTK